MDNTSIHETETKREICVIIHVIIKTRRKQAEIYKTRRCVNCIGQPIQLFFLFLFYRTT